MELHRGFLSDSDLKYFNEYIDSISHRFIHFDILYNLVNVRHLYIDHTTEIAFNLLFEEFRLSFGKDKRLFGAYVLEYVEGSFANVHFDNKTDLTCVTVLKQNNLIGGDTMFGVKNNITSLMKNSQSKIIPDKNKLTSYKIVKINPGDCISYTKKELHGVTEVESGLRRVLVLWFVND